MDELTAALAGSFQVSSDPDSTAAAHPRFTQYKIKKRVDQEERRSRMLTSQKQSRLDYVNLVRQLGTNTWDSDIREDMEWQDTGGKPGRHYKNQLMLSEWMVEVPEDLQENWLMVACPVGRRNLVVASQGSTRAYSKSGFKMLDFHSLLPGGNKHGGNWKRAETILDCMFYEPSRTFYVLDIMCWKGNPVYESDTEFRFYWMQTKLAEIPELSSYASTNPYTFIPLQNNSCDNESIKKVLESSVGGGYSVEVDGLLFYHKETNYTFGSTPLVTWLKPYMIPEILSVPVPEHYMKQKPSSYKDFSTHSQMIKKNQEEASKRKGPQSSPGQKKVLQKPKKGGGGEKMEVTQEHTTQKGRRRSKGKKQNKEEMDTTQAQDKENTPK